jgi:hypothetical protein
MRRFVLIFMMLLLPFQWSWAAAGSVCEHEAGGTHFGHHQHEHQAAPDAPAHADGGDDGAEPFNKHPDCDACHGLCAGILPSPAEAGAAWAGELPAPAYGRHLPEPPVGSLLRPPSALVA